MTSNQTRRDKRDGSTKIYPNAKISEDESLLAILSYALRHKLSKIAIADVLDLVNLHSPVENNAVPQSLYRFLNCFDEYDDPVEIQHCCPNCKVLFGNEVPAQCTSCSCIPGDVASQVKSGAVFLKLSIRKQLERQLSDPKFCEALQHKWSRSKTNPDSLDDIYDGAMYKSIPALNNPDKCNISLSWNVDGVPIFKSSPFHIWPLQITINELPPHLRLKHAILGGLWFGPTKPDMNSFLQPFVDECVTLENEGLPCVYNGEHTVVCAYSLLCVCDSVARCQVQNIKQFNGEYRCNWCYNKGEVVQKGNGLTGVPTTNF